MGKEQRVIKRTGYQEGCRACTLERFQGQLMSQVLSSSIILHHPETTGPGRGSLAWNYEPQDCPVGRGSGNF